MKNYAIVLGVDKYSNANDLPSCANDAKVMEELLTATGKYRILHLPSDIDKHKAQEEITTFLSKGEEDVGEVLFYFSGHGMQDAEMHYVLKETSVDKINSTALNNAEVDAIVKRVSPKLFVKIIDACNSGLSYIKNLGESISEEMTITSKEFENCIFICSSKQSQVSYAGDQYSYFTKAIIDAVDSTDNKVVKYTDLQNYLRDVFAGSEQTPYFSTQCDGTDVFCEKTEEVCDFLAGLKGETVEEIVEVDTDADVERIAAYIKSCREQLEVRSIMDEIRRTMDEQDLEDELLNEFYEFHCSMSAPHIRQSYREDPDIVRMLYKQPMSENLFVEIETMYVKKENPYVGWYTSHKKVPVSFVSTARQMPEVIAYHIKGKDKNLPDYVVPFVFVYSPTFFYVFTCIKQFLRKGWNEYEESGGRKYTFAKFEYQRYSKDDWLVYLKGELEEKIGIAREMLLEFIP